jgi:hypothetical protein
MTFRSQTQLASQRILAALANGTDELFDCIDALLPLNAEQALTWQVWLAFWGAAVGDPVLGEEQRLRQQLFVDNLVERVEGGQRKGTLRADLVPDDAARYVAAVVDGVSIQAMFAPDRWSADEQRRFVRAQLAALRVPAPPSSN